MDGEMLRRLPKYCVEDPDRYGNVRIYLKRPGVPKVRLHGSPWSPAFMQAYAAAISPSAPVDRKRKASDKTWRWLCERYFQSAEFRFLGPTTRPVRERILRATWDEPLKPGAEERFADFPLADMEDCDIKVLRDRKIDTPGMANERLKAIRGVFKFGKEAKHVKFNVAKEVSRFKYQTDGFYTWTDEDVAKFEAFWPSGSKPRLALACLLYVGPRAQDVVRLGRGSIKDGAIIFRPKKTERKTGTIVEFPVLAPLQTEIDLMPKGQMLFFITQHGKPYSVKGFENWFKRQCKMAALHPDAACHGLRKASATRAAENGATPHQLMAMYGWTDIKTAMIYTMKAQRKKLAAAGANFLEKSPTPIPGGLNQKIA